jgi:hypothetical protein
MPAWLDRRKVLFAVFAVAALVLARSFLFRTEEDKVRLVLRRVVEKAQATATTSPLARAQEVRSLGSHFADEIVVHLEEEEGSTPADPEAPRGDLVRSRRELEQRALAAKSSFKSLEVLLLPASVAVDGQKATARAEVHVLGSLPDIEGQFYERRLVTFELRKSDGSWKIWKVSAKNLRSSGG